MKYKILEKISMSIVYMLMITSNLCGIIAFTLLYIKSDEFILIVLAGMQLYSLMVFSHEYIETFK